MKSFNAFLQLMFRNSYKRKRLNLLKALPHLKINKFTDSLTSERVALGKQRLNSQLHVCIEGPDRGQSDATNSLECWAGNKVLRQNQSERKICKVRSKKEKPQTFPDTIDGEQNF